MNACSFVADSNLEHRKLGKILSPNLKYIFPYQSCTKNRQRSHCKRNLILSTCAVLEKYISPDRCRQPRTCFACALWCLDARRLCSPVTQHSARALLAARSNIRHLENSDFQQGPWVWQRRAWLLCGRVTIRPCSQVQSQLPSVWQY